MKKTVLLFYVILISALTGQQLVSGAQSDARQKENLGRGLVAYRQKVSSVNYVFVSWRYLSSDDIATKFNIYKQPATSSSMPTKVNATPVETATWYRYMDNGLEETKYYLKTVDGAGVESAGYVAEYTLKATASISTTAPYIEIPMKAVTGDTGATGVDGAGGTWQYSVNDASAADLDGDGEMEIVVHRVGASQDNANSGITDAPVLQAYKLDGTFMWEINLGVNIREGAHYTQFMVYDLDGDGKAEVVCKTAEGTKDSKGTNVGEAYFPTYKAKYGFTTNYNANANYRNSSGYILQGPEFLTVFNGETGEEVVTTEYDPPRYSASVPSNGNETPVLNPTGTNINSRWGDSYGNRCDRFLACVAYLDGVHPSVVMCRGYYTRSVLVAYDFDGTNLTKRWKFDTSSGKPGLSAYAGQGNHNLRVADVNGDGKDEIIYGSMAVNNDGTPLYNTRLGHGDAMHIGDYIIDRPGLEVFACHESGGNGVTLRDAATGQIIYQFKSPDTDVGRCMGTDVNPNSRGMEFWGGSAGGVMSSATGLSVGTTSGTSSNMACWWDGDLLRELQDGTRVTKYNYSGGGSTVLLDPTSVASNNSTKSNPCLQADIVGDWREEVILRASNNKSIRIYLTPIATTYRFHTFLEDPVYRLSIVYQNVAYNQPTGTGFYFGSDLEKIFPVKNLEASDATYTLDPVFDAISYTWSTGETALATTKQLVLNSADYEKNINIPFTLAMNFRGRIFTETVNVKFLDTGNGIGSETTDGKAIKAIEYYDLTGKAASESAKGFVIVKTIYEDGSELNTKVVK
ncbi:rhamnogalacturonan lyase [Viscerimonas tarda]